QILLQVLASHQEQKGQPGDARRSLLFSKPRPAERLAVFLFGAQSHALRFPFPEKYPASACPVYDFFTRATCSGVPWATSLPPSSPPSGPRSIIQSALRTTSRLCSMMMIELPRSVNRCRTSSNFLTSSKCRPVVGSSSRYKVFPVCRLLNSRASLMRC